ncbi:MAG: hypothetical protein HQL23_09605 [Candidatus Omnitrophica bacterium]|nr:hypothetical protein [Candidatus Omnitrophota bacterium]
MNVLPNLQIFRRFLALFLSAAMIFNPIFSFGQSAFIQSLPLPGQMIGLTKGLTPVILKGMIINPQDPLKFDFIFDTGTGRAQGEVLRQEADKAIKYFLASLTVPEKELWVNLSPVEKDRIIPDGLSKTAMGRDMLAEDYVLKQLTASLHHPDTAVGKQLWQKIYNLAEKELGSRDAAVDTLNRVWIVPAQARIWEHDGKAMILKSHLKVMMEKDYHNSLTRERSERGEGQGRGTFDAKVTQIYRDILIPAIEQEVNQGQNFSKLRQIYAAMILATWYKIRLKESFLGKAYADQNKVAGVGFSDGVGKNEIYEKYLQSAHNGVFNLIKEEVDPVNEDSTARKYFSGGFSGAGMSSPLTTIIERGEVPTLSSPLTGEAVIVSAGSNPVGASVDQSYLDRIQDQGASAASSAAGPEFAGDPAEMAEAIKLLNSRHSFYSEIEKRKSAVAALRLGSKQAGKEGVAALAARLSPRTEQEQSIRIAAIYALAQIGRDAPDKAVRESAVNAIAEKIITRHDEVESDTVRMAAVDAVESIGGQSAVKAFVNYGLYHSEPSVNIAVIGALERLYPGAKIAVGDFLIGKVGKFSFDYWLESALIDALTRIALSAGKGDMQKRIVEGLISVFNDKMIRGKTCADAVRALGKIHSDQAFIAINREGLSSGRSEVRAAAFRALASWGNAFGALDKIRSGLNDREATVRAAAAEALGVAEEKPGNTSASPVRLPAAVGNTDIINSSFRQLQEGGSVADRVAAAGRLAETDQLSLVPFLDDVYMHSDEHTEVLEAIKQAIDQLKGRESERQRIKSWVRQLSADLGDKTDPRSKAIRELFREANKLELGKKFDAERSNLIAGGLLGERREQTGLYDPNAGRRSMVMQVMAILLHNNKLTADAKKRIMQEFAGYQNLWPDVLENKAIFDREISASFSSPVRLPLGGIDFDPAKMGLEIKLDGNKVPLPASMQNWDMPHIQGFIPVIYNIKPVNFSLLLGLNSAKDKPAAAGANNLPLGKELEGAGV